MWKKQWQDNYFTSWIQQLELALVALQQYKTGDQGVIKEPKISLPTKFDGTVAGT